MIRVFESTGHALYLLSIQRDFYLFQYVPHFLCNIKLYFFFNFDYFEHDPIHKKNNERLS